jgi:hypothetical protein
MDVGAPRALVGCIVSFALVLLAAVSGGGCKAEDDESSSAGAMSGGDIARGMMGVDRSAAADNPRASKLADALVAEIEAEHPGRLAEVAADMRSHDRARVLGGKRALDAMIDAAAASPAMATRAAGGGGGGGASLVTSSRPLDAPLVGSSNVAPTPTQITCDVPKDANGNPVHLGQVDGRYGDDRTGISGAARDALDIPVPGSTPIYVAALNKVDSGSLKPDPESRLGAYAATGGYPSGTVGSSVHTAIGTIYATLGDYGGEKVGRVFNSPEAKSLLGQPVDSCAGLVIAKLEHQYWSDVAAEDSFSAGGQLGAAFNPTVRNFLQVNVF